MENILWIGSEFLLTIFILGSLGISVVPKLFQKLIPSFQETYLADFLPFKNILEDKKTIECWNGKFCRIFFLKGVAAKTFTKEEKNFLEARKQSFFDAMAERGEIFRFFTKRGQLHFNDTVHFENSVLQEIHERWNHQFQSCYFTKHYLFIQSLTYKSIEEISVLVRDHLALFNPQLIEGNNKQEEGCKSSLLTFLSGLMNPSPYNIFSVIQGISEFLTYSQVLFDLKEGHIEIKDGNQSCFYKVLSIKGWGEKSDSEFLKEILRLSFECEILHLYKGLKKLDARGTLRYRLSQENLIFKNTFKNEEFEQAINHLEAGHYSLYDYQLTIFVREKNLQELHQHIAVLKKILLNYGIKPVEETDAIEWLWFSRFPGYDQISRPRNLFSHNLSSFLSFEENREGHVKSDWGEGPLRYFKTTQGNSYAFQLHVGDEKEALAHSLTIAPSSCGKTTFFQHLIGGALRHKNLRAFIFDRFNGTRIFTESLGGAYIDLHAKSNLQLNPLHCEDTQENRLFLTQFFLKLGQSRENSSLEMAARSLDTIFKMPYEHRSLKSVYPYIFDINSDLREGILPWVEGGYAPFLNGERDCLDFKLSRLMAFEMTDLLKDVRLSSVLIDYILHRIRSQVRAEASPHLIFIDEAAPMLEDPFFAQQVQTLFREHRKLRGSINICFQEAHSILKSPISETILNNCPTFFLFQNVNAKAEEYAPLNLSEFEWAFIKGATSFAQHIKRGVLLKRNQESLVLDVNLENLGIFLNIYKSGAEPLKLMRTLKELWGDKWVEHYLESF